MRLRGFRMLPNEGKARADQREPHRQHGGQGGALDPAVERWKRAHRRHRIALLICRIGIRIENATKAITAPMATMIKGSISAVSAPIRTFTWFS